MCIRDSHFGSASGSLAGNNAITVPRTNGIDIKRVVVYGYVALRAATNSFALQGGLVEHVILAVWRGTNTSMPEENGRQKLGGSEGRRPGIPTGPEEKILMYHLG